MIPWRRVVISAATHGLALAGGWLVYDRVKQKEAATIPTAESKAGPREAKLERTVDEILKEVAGPGKQKTAAQSEWEKFQQTVAKEIAAMTPPADFAAALEEALKSWSVGSPQERPASAKIVALMYHWLAADPKALFAWLSQDPARNQAASKHLALALQELVRNGRGATLAESIGSAGRYENLVRNLMAMELGKKPDAAAMAAAKDRSTPEQWKNFCGLMTGGWPPEKKAELLQLAREENDPGMLANFCRRLPEGAAWVSGLMNDASLPEEFRQALSADPSVRQMLAADPKTPLEDRLKYMDGMDPEAARAQLTRQDVNRLIFQPRDWTHAFRHGEASAEEIYQQIAAGTPELAAASPEALRNQVFLELAEEDPAGAMELLKDLPEDQRHETMLKSARTFFNNVDPEIFVEALQQVPSDTPELWDQRLDAWNIRAFTNSNRLNEDFMAWVREMPPGIDREMGLYSLARAVQLTDLKLAAQLRSEVTDAELQKRIAENR